MAIQSRRGNIASFDKGKMLPGEWGVALDSQEVFACFGAGVTKKMATHEDFSDMLEESVTATENAKQATVNANTAVEDFKGLVVSKLAINDAVKSTTSGWSSTKIGAELDTAKTTLNTNLANQIGVATGSSINLPNSYNGGLLLKELQGKSVQNGTPTPDVKVDIVSVGDNGSVVARVTGKNVLPSGAVKTLTNSGITAIVNADGTIISNGTSTWGDINNWILGNYRVNPTVANTIVTLYPGNTYYVKDVELFTYENGVDGRIYPGKITILASQYPNGFRVTGVRHVTVAVGTILTNKVYYPQIELGTVATSYEQYKEQLITIPLTQPLRSVNGVYDRIIKKDGVWSVERNVSTIVFDGSSDENIAYYSSESTGNTSLFQLGGTKPWSVSSNIISNRFVTAINGILWVTGYDKEGISLGGSSKTTIDIRINSSRLSDKSVSGIRTWLQANPITVYYAPATPTWEPLSQSVQDALNKLQSYQGVTNVFTTDALQPTLIVEYGKTDTAALTLYANNIYDNKIDKSKVTNSLAVTEEGFVADPRAIKTINDKVDVLNNNFVTLSDYQIIGLESFANTSYCTVTGAVIKQGKICIINGTIATTAELVAGSTYFVMQNIGSVVKAKVPIRINYTVDSAGCGAKGSVESNNTVSLIPIMQNIPSGKYIEFFGVYICE